MKILITFSSRSGNTEKLAKAVYDSLEGEKEIYSIDEAPPADRYDLTAVGFWFQAGKPDPKAAQYLASCGPETHLFLFATHGAAKDSGHAREGMDSAIALTNNACIEGVFNCQGQVNPKVLEKVRQKETPPAWINDADTAVGHPDGTDISNLKALLNTLKP